MTTALQKPDRPPKLTRKARLDRAAAECVEEILAATQADGGEPWFSIIRRKMQALNTGTEKEG